MYFTPPLPGLDPGSQLRWSNTADLQLGAECALPAMAAAALLFLPAWGPPPPPARAAQLEELYEDALEEAEEAGVVINLTPNFQAAAPQTGASRRTARA